MKVILVSDLHLVAPGVHLFGLDPLQQLERCIAAINTDHGDADLVIFAGDLTNDGEASAYAALAERLAGLAVPYRLMMGNHDDRERFGAAFPDAPDVDGFFQTAIDIGKTRLILTDTLWPGKVDGLLCEGRLAWLDGQLADAGEVLLFMHHPPFAIGIEALDACRLSNPQDLLEIIRRHGNVRHIFAGHVHRQSQGDWHGIPFTTVRGTSHQSALKFKGPHEISFEAPAFSIILANSDTLVVHAQEFPGRP